MRRHRTALDHHRPHHRTTPNHHRPHHRTTPNHRRPRHRTARNRRRQWAAADGAPSAHAHRHRRAVRGRAGVHAGRRADRRHRGRRALAPPAVPLLSAGRARPDRSPRCRWCRRRSWTSARSRRRTRCLSPTYAACRGTTSPASRRRTAPVVAGPFAAWAVSVAPAGSAERLFGQRAAVLTLTCAVDCPKGRWKMPGQLLDGQYVAFARRSRQGGWRKSSARLKNWGNSS